MTSEEDNLREIVKQLETAWNNGDSAGFSAPFAEDADFIHILGGHFIGRAAIEKGHRVIFDTIYKGSTVKFVVEKIRFAGSEVAIVFIYSALTTSQPGLPPQLNARPTMVLQRHGDGWKVVTFQNTLVTPEGAPAGKDSLAEKHPIKGQSRAMGR